MTERPTDLVYGHLGDPIYDGGTQEWYFPRIASTFPRIRALGSANTVLEGSAGHPNIIKQTASDRHQHARNISKGYPDLAPALGLTLSNALLSEAVTNITAIYEPIASELFDLGTATNTASLQQVPPIPIAAIVAGSGCELIRLVSLCRKHLSWDGDEAFGIHCLTASGGEQGWWKANGGPIYQICFAAKDEGERGSLIAVRYQGAISILQPTLRRDVFSPNQNAMQNFLLPASRLDANEIVNIHARELSSLPFADVSFNPWNHKQIAVIDQAGAWNVLELKSPVKDQKDQKTWQVKKICSGCLEPVVGSDATRSLSDGWARILWINDSQMLLIASRRSFNLVMINRSMQELDLPDLSLAKSTDWILDVKRVPGIPGHIFLVTSTRLFWLEARIIRDAEDSSDLKASLSILLCWIHYRNPDDTSLCLNVITENPQEEGEDKISIKVLTYSRLVNIIITYSFEYKFSQNRAISIVDPYIIPINYGLVAAEEASPSTLVLQPLSYNSKMQIPASGLVKDYMDQGVRFYQLSILSASLALAEGLYALSLPQSYTSIQEPDVRAFQQEPKTASKYQDEYILPDALAHEEILSVAADGVSQGCALFLPVSPGQDQRTLRWEWLFEFLYSPVVSKISGEEAIEIIKATLETNKSKETPNIQTLFELMPKEIPSSDMEDTDAILNAILEQTSSLYKSTTSGTDVNRYPTQSTKPLMTPTMESLLGFSSNDGIQRIYDSLTQTFVSPLPTEVPSRVRVWMDKRLQSVALLLFLASQTVSPIVSANEDDDPFEPNIEAPENLALDLPVRTKVPLTSQIRKGKEKSSQRSSPPAVSSQTTPSAQAFRMSSQQSDHSTVRSNISLNPSERSLLATIPAEDMASQRLRSITTLTPQPALPTTLSSILSHWTVGADPAAYNWAATQKALAAAAEGKEKAESSQSKRAERKKRLQKNIEDWSASRPLRDRPVIGASQPMGVANGSQTIATQESEGVSMSQPLPGPHGMRQSEKTRKKRKQGF